LPRQPPSKKFKASVPGAPGPSHRKGRDRDVPATARPDREVDEDVRQMETEADDLRRQSRAHPSSDTSKPHSSSQYTDTILPLAPRETPQIEKNKAMRGESSQPSGSGGAGGPGGGHRRRSSLSMRGKRTSTSFATTGIISEQISSLGVPLVSGGMADAHWVAHPHSSVGDISFFKHIDADLHESLRARQLIIWCASRSSAELSPDPSSTPKRSNPKDNGKDPPALSAAAKSVFKTLMDDTIKMLAERQIDTSVVTPPTDGEGQESPKMRENEQNVKNRAREIKFSADIARAHAEEEAWREVTDFYNSHQAAVVADIERSRQTRASAKAKGKQRADPSDNFEPRESELSDDVRANVRLAREILAEGLGQKDALDKRIEDLPYKIDHLRSLVVSSSQITAVAENDLDQRFAQLSLVLRSRTHARPPPSVATANASGSLSSYLPPRTQPVADPIDLFRALSRIDMARPPGQISEAAQRAAREVQRAQEGGGSLVPERRLTAGVVAPPTPRKPPGTPRRSGR
ncbi:hypothetical protein EVG20_g11265, partial [Dentipellis fragilis]